MIRRIGLSVLVATLVAVTASPGGAAPSPAPSAPAERAATASPAPNSPRAIWDAAVHDATGVEPPAVRAAAFAAVAAAAVTLSVTPDTGLVRGQSVAVSASGLPAGSVAVLQCGDDSTAAFDCNLSDLTFLTPDATGALSASKTVRRTIPSVGGYRDCAAEAGTCEIAIASTSGQLLARHPLAFDPNAPQPDSKITVDPATGLVAGQTVNVTGSGFVPGQPVSVRTCATGSSFCNDSGSFITSDANGAFSARLTLSLRVHGADNAVTNCLDVACVVRATTSNDPDFDAQAPITFDPSQPRPPTPTILVAPATGLLHDQEVTVTGSGFDPSMYVDIQQCGDDHTSYCGDYIGNTQADEHGAFTRKVRVSRLATEYLAAGPSIVDCAETTCSVVATGYGEEDQLSLEARAGIQFDASVAPPAPPKVTVSPDHDLPYRAQVAIHGAGFAPNTSVYAQFCVRTPTEGTCGFEGVTQTADGSGAVDLALNVRRRTTAGDPGDTVLDCVDPGTTCSVQVQGERGFERVEVPITFDPDAPVPPPPALVVTPDHDLGWRAVVTVAGSGFTPGSIQVRQCGQVIFDATQFTSCTGYRQVEVGAGGSFSTPFAVRRVLDDQFPAPVDCATAASACTLEAGNAPDEQVRVPLTFDPSSQPPPPPVLAYWPPGHLLDGRTVMLVGAGFTPNATVGLAQCRAGATAIADSCDLGRAFTATADASGRFAMEWKPFGAGGNSQGPFDCTGAPQACVLAAANADELSEFATIPLTFDAPELMLQSTEVTEGTGDMPTMAEVMAELSEPIGTDVTVAWHTTPGTAGEHDFTMRHGRVVIPAGETMAMIHAEVTADAIDERAERFAIDVDSAAGTMLAEGHATVTISDDDRRPRVSIDDGQGNEADGHLQAAVHLSAPSGRTVTVQYATHRGSARRGSDYRRTRGRLEFAPGETTKDVSVPLVDDRAPERTERFTVELFDPEHASTGRSVGTMTIRDDDRKRPSRH
jgi:hypothetical protein